MRTVFALTAFLAIASSASAQSAESVTVNPNAVYGGGGGNQQSRVLIDPGTGQPRVVPPLMEPWQAAPIRLHPPHKHHAALPSDTALTAPPPVVHKPRRTAAVQPAAPVRQSPPPKVPAQQAAPASGLGDLTDLVTQSPQTPRAKTEPPKAADKPAPRVAVAPPPKPVVAPPPKPVVAPPPKPVAAPPPKPVVAPPSKPVEQPRAEPKQASIEPSRPAKARASAGARKDSIVFAPNASDPSSSAVSAIRTLAGSLSNALGDSNARVQLLAYAGARGEKSSDTRRLSLKRALVVRQLLIDDGLPSERIDVFALGGSDDDGPLDRVDVFVKS